MTVRCNVLRCCEGYSLYLLPFGCVMGLTSLYNNFNHQQVVTVTEVNTAAYESKELINNHNNMKENGDNERKEDAYSEYWLSPLLGWDVNNTGNCLLFPAM